MSNGHAIDPVASRSGDTPGRDIARARGFHPQTGGLTDMASIFEKMANTAPGSAIETFKFVDQGDMIAGIVTGFNQGTSDYGPFDVIELDQLDPKTGKPSGEIKSVAMLGTVLSNQFNRFREQGTLLRGSEVAIRYDGLVKGNAANPYKDYTFLCEPPNIAAKMARTPTKKDADLAEPQDTLPF